MSEPGYFQRLAWRVLDALPQCAGGRAVLVTSARRGEGKSYVAAALASALSEQSARPIALCDCELPVAPGAAAELSDTVSGMQLIPAAMTDLGAVVASSPGGVIRIPFGRRDVSPFHSPAVKQAIDVLRLHCGVVIVDGPVLADCGALAACTDGTLLVVNSERTRREIVKGTLQSNPHIRQKIMGAVLNQLPRYIPRWLYRRAL